MKDLSAFQRDTLRKIASMEEPIGLGIKTALEDYYDEEVNHGRLYPNLDDLVEAGFIEKAEKDGRTNTYTLTEEGRQAISERDSWNSEHSAPETEKNLTAQ